MNKIFGKNIQQNERMINTKFRVVVTPGGGEETKGPGRGTWETSEVWVIFSFKQG